MKLIRPLAALVLLVASALPALAADAVYPPGLRLGMVPLVGLSKAKTFPGFENEDGSVKVLITELPPAAYNEVVSAFNANPAGTNGVKPDKIETSAGLAYFTTEGAKVGDTLVKRYSMIVPGTGFSGYVAVQIPENAAKIYTDEAVRQMFATATIRKEVSVDEQIGLLPFKITDLAGFKDVRTLVPGSSIILADGSESSGYESKPFIILGLIGATPQAADDRARFAQEAALQIPGLRETKITMSEPIRINSQPGFETRIDGVSGKDKTPVTVVQWIRFGGGTSLRIIASAPRDQWSDAFTRFRAVRDGIQPKG
ncbi:hypothetical protein L6654_32370 [Bradyrhizobium sp. WYCCWR 13023]|jgi:hypothetical protein|uniref:Uncharacterized protein n=1 Tax=Bradyrhizobium zhengyangense TaxID=2911009 RepID=A0A9X1UAK4_9BRAD|nr:MULTISPECIES: hypothetical protein [Bradyrhizobium]MCG2631335.1 hypothetical protein [Bradyrhizobium zhengyangense]MCG2639299.1 hypothetical protein [Bradyrhizobium zhengyangense]MCG2669390.1 hypothetical protein [Bradyrhizobium zhengyangense]MDA9525793.1 hypothetical protein [Bradyrhizobium sp. CCBAU 11434]